MRVLLLTQWFQPEKTFKGLPFAKELVKLGHEVQVLTGFPNYPGGKLYPGYKVKLWDYEEMEGIPVYRTALYPSHDKSAIRRIVNYLSFGLSSFLLGPFLVKKPDMIYVYNLVTLLPTAKLSSIFYRAPIVLDVQDLWPESLQLSGMFDSKLGLKIAEWCSNIAYRLADKVVVLSPGFRNKLIERNVPSEKVRVIYNWCYEDELKQTDYDEKLTIELGFKDRFNVLFAGNMGTAQGLDAVLDAAQILQDKHPAVQFVFIGGGVEEPKLKEYANRMKLDNVLFLPRRAISGMPPIFALADVLLVHLKSNPLYDIWIPSKLQAYMHIGKPIIVGVRGDAAELVNQANCGVTCEPSNPESIAQSVIKLYSLPQAELNRMGSNAKQYYKEQLSLESGVAKFDKIFRKGVVD